MEQLGLELRPPTPWVRELNPPAAHGVETSTDAAARARAFVHLQLEAVYAFIRTQGPIGATQKEIAEALGMQRASVCPRVWSLAGGKRLNGAPTERVRIRRNGVRRDHCAVYVIV